MNVSDRDNSRVHGCNDSTVVVIGSHDELGSEIEHLRVAGADVEFAKERVVDFELCRAQQLHFCSSLRDRVPYSRIGCERDDGIISQPNFSPLIRAGRDTGYTGARKLSRSRAK